MISRREFMQALARLAPVLGGSGLILSEPALIRSFLDTLEGTALAGDGTDELIREAPRARFWSAAAKGQVQCHLCARGCLLAGGQRGLCRSRMNVGGRDEKPCLWPARLRPCGPHREEAFLPFPARFPGLLHRDDGCPLRCKFCQNWQTSQASPEDYRGPLHPARGDRRNGALPQRSPSSPTPTTSRWCSRSTCSTSQAPPGCGASAPRW